MKVVYEGGDEKVAKVYAAYMRGSPEHMVEFVESLSGSPSIDEKWVLIISSQFGCPVRCRFCDASIFYRGNLTAEEMLAQVDFMVRSRYPDGNVPAKKFKVQFARMGEPALNDAVIDAMLEIRRRYRAPGYMPCISTVAPAGRDEWFGRLLEANRKVFRGWFQLQFSLHSTDQKYRDWLVPIRKWGLNEIAEYGERFYVGGRKVTLNFALSPGARVDPSVISEHFDPHVFALKFTPVNPTVRAEGNGMVNVFTEREADRYVFLRELREMGYDVIVSIGELVENEIGSNCGQLVMRVHTGT
jgi:23S rRNA (adenine2503-C2)-methyltransferase